MNLAKRALGICLVAALCLSVCFVNFSGSPVKSGSVYDLKNNTDISSVAPLTGRDEEKTESGTEVFSETKDDAAVTKVAMPPQKAEKVSVDENGDRIVKKIIGMSSPVTSVTKANALNENTSGSGVTYEANDYNKPLSPLAQVIYNAAVPEIKKTYNGEIEYANTGIVDISENILDKIGVDVQNITWGPERDPDDVYAEADNIVKDLISRFSTDEENAKIEAMTRLLCEYPNELFWFDKTQGMISGFTYYIGAVYIEKNGVDTLQYYCIEKVCYLAKFLVANDFKNQENPLTYCPYEETDEEGNQLVDENGIPFVPRYEDGSYDSKNNYGWYCENVSIEAIEKMRNAEDMANRVIDAAANFSDSKKLKYYHDYILNTITYNTDAAYRQETYGNAWQMIYVFDDDDTTNVVCEGYSKAFKYLCDHTNFNCDLKCLIVTGNLYQNGRLLGGHMWNNIIKDGVVLHCDLTNNDNDFGDKRPFYSLFEAQPKAVKNGHYYYSQSSSVIHYVLDEEMHGLYKDDVVNLEPVFSIGDVNMDGEINMKDAVIIALSENQSLSFLEKILADIDNNSVVNNNDILVISEK